MSTRNFLLLLPHYGLVGERSCGERFYSHNIATMPATPLSQMIPIRSATVVLSIVLPIVAIASVGLRFAARKARKLPFLKDDWVGLVALVRFKNSL